MLFNEAVPTVAQDVTVVAEAALTADLSGVTSVSAELRLNGTVLDPRVATVADDGTATGTASVTFDVGELPEPGILLVDLVFTYDSGAVRTLREPIAFDVRSRITAA